MLESQQCSGQDFWLVMVLDRWLWPRRHLPLVLPPTQSFRMSDVAAARSLGWLGLDIAFAHPAGGPRGVDLIPLAATKRENAFRV